MSPKEHGTSHTPVQQHLRWNVDWNTADKICNFNRVFAEYAGSFAKNRDFVKEVGGDNNNNDNNNTVLFYDSNTGKLVFTAPVGRTMEEFWEESLHHGWPSFRDEEVNWDVVRVLEDGETVSLGGTHLGHNLPDTQGNRFCINLVSIAGNPVASEETEDEEEKGEAEEVEEKEEEEVKEDEGSN